MTADTERVAMIDALNALDPNVGASFDRLTELTAFSLRAPVAFVSIVGLDTQRLVSRVGLALDQTHRDIAICSLAVEQRSVLAIPDLTRDARFCDHPLVVDPPHLRAYLAAPLITPQGIAIGTLCVMDRDVRSFSAQECTQLTTLAGLVMGQIDLRNLAGRREPVSGLPNRQQFQIDLDALRQREGGQGILYAVMIDICDVGRANEAGQAVGMKPLEAMIRRAGLRLKAALDEVADLYHVGVTRFCFVLRASSPQEVEGLVLQLRGRMRRPLMAAGVPMSPHFHAGICAFDLATDAADDVMRKTLIGLHPALSEQRAVGWYSPLRDASLRRNYLMASDVEKSLGNGDFSLVYQPRVRLDGRRPDSVEALLRWQHPTLGAVSPAEFIPMFERAGLIGPVSHWVARQAVSQLASWRAQGLDLSLSINLSPRDLDDDRLWPMLLKQLTHLDVPASALEIEVTEGQWLRLGSGAERLLRTMADAGVRIAIDDFGSGYSNFGYLTELPIHTIKVDRSLFEHVATSERSRVRVAAVLQLARDLGFRTVAEGIETRVQWDLLSGWECDEVQGYFVARPMRAVEVERFFSTAPHPARTPWLAGNETPAAVLAAANDAPMGRARRI